MPLFTLSFTVYKWSLRAAASPNTRFYQPCLELPTSFHVTHREAKEMEPEEKSNDSSCTGFIIIHFRKWSKFVLFLFSLPVLSSLIMALIQAGAKSLTLKTLGELVYAFSSQFQTWLNPVIGSPFLAPPNNPSTLHHAAHFIKVVHFNIFSRWLSEGVSQDSFTSIW